MKVVYLESSALLTWLFGETKSSKILSQINETKIIVSSVITILESERAIVRSENEKIISSSDSHKLKRQIEIFKNEWLFIQRFFSIALYFLSRFFVKSL